MLGESRLNIYVLAPDLSSRQRERIQAQIATGLRSLPQWVFALLQQRIETLGSTNLPLIIEPQSSAVPFQVLSLGRVESRPAVKLTPRLSPEGVDWGQDLRRLLAKAIAWILAPEDIDSPFWRRWKTAVEADQLRDKAADSIGGPHDDTDLGLLIEMFAAHALNPKHQNWDGLPRVRSFLEDWRSGS
ncbi:MAG TPA: hypothetical protein VGR43_10930 [Dehalococcoidia bacterium]|jgi:hypothetical protein|nr:hypothetical protein [Dehalococcoidia bacterium]